MKLMTRQGEGGGNFDYSTICHRVAGGFAQKSDKYLIMFVFNIKRTLYLNSLMKYRILHFIFQTPCYY